jgi:tRNA A-37 threonylcarbamoyl transferase component Bud32
MQQLPQSWETEGSMLKNGSRSTVKLITIDSTPYVIKIYKKMPFHRRLRYALTRSRAFQSWVEGVRMTEHQLPVASPLAIIEERQFGIPGRAALIMESAKGENLLSLVTENQLSSEGFQTVARNLTRTFDKMRDLSITHGDMKATNIIIDDELNIRLIDIDAAQQHKSSNSFDKARNKDKERFIANWKNHPDALQAFSAVYT